VRLFIIYKTNVPVDLYSLFYQLVYSYHLRNECNSNNLCVLIYFAYTHTYICKFITKSNKNHDHFFDKYACSYNYQTKWLSFPIQFLLCSRNAGRECQLPFGDALGIWLCCRNLATIRGFDWLKQCYESAAGLNITLFQRPPTLDQTHSFDEHKSWGMSIDQCVIPLT